MVLEPLRCREPDLRCAVSSIRLIFKDICIVYNLFLCISANVVINSLYSCFSMDCAKLCDFTEFLLLLDIVSGYH